MGIGLAIPVNMAKTVYEQLIEGGPVVRGFLGVGNPTGLTPELAASFGLKEDTKGVLIPEVIEDSAAEKAGLKRNDIIVEFNGKPLEKATELLNRVAALKPGTEVKIVVLRNGKRKTLTAELGERPRRAEIIGAKPEALEQLGITVQELTEELARQLGYEGYSGVVVTEVERGSPATREGIRRGTLIMEVNRKQVSNVREFNRAIEKAAKEGSVLLLIKQRHNYPRYVVPKLPKDK